MLAAKKNLFGDTRALTVNVREGPGKGSKSYNSVISYCVNIYLLNFLGVSLGCLSHGVAVEILDPFRGGVTNVLEKSDREILENP